MTTESEVLTVAEAATLLKIGPRTLYRLIDAGVLPAVRMGRALRIPRDALMEHLEATARAAVRATTGT